HARLPLTFGVGIPFVIVTAGIDVSVGSVLVFAGVVAAKVMVAGGGAKAGWGTIALGAAAGIATGAGWGLVSGILIPKLRIPPLIATLGILGIALGLAEVITDGSDIGAPSRLSDVVGNYLIARQLPVIA